MLSSRQMPIYLSPLKRNTDNSNTHSYQHLGLINKHSVIYDMYAHLWQQQKQNAWWKSCEELNYWLGWALASSCHWDQCCLRHVIISGGKQQRGGSWGGSCVQRINITTVPVAWFMLTEHRTTQHRHGRLAIIDGKKCIFITKKYPIVKVNNRALTKLNSSYYNNLYRITNTSRFAKDIYIMIYR